MIERYSTPEMTMHFNETARFQYMLKVEIAVAKVQAQMKIIPIAAARDIEKKSKINLPRM
jgi:adenylosuccinate lyase